MSCLQLGVELVRFVAALVEDRVEIGKRVRDSVAFGCSRERGIGSGSLPARTISW